MKKVNVILVIERGIVKTPIVTTSDTTAQAEFDNIAELLLGDDVSEINLHSDTQVDELNRIVNRLGVSVSWFTDVELNTYKN